MLADGRAARDAPPLCASRARNMVKKSTRSDIKLRSRPVVFSMRARRYRNVLTCTPSSLAAVDQCPPW